MSTFFALVSADGTVENVLVADDSISDGQQFFGVELGLGGHWVQAFQMSDGNPRKQFPAPNWRYDADADVFIAPQPFPSWTLDANYDWQPPTPMPAEGGPWVWDETTLSWVKVTA